MIEKIIFDYLSKEITDVKTYTERPKTLPSLPFILIEKTGSNRENTITTATIAVQSYGNTLLEAVDLNEKVKRAMFESVKEDNIARCSLNTDYNWTDETMKKYRFQAVFNITYYE